MCVSICVCLSAGPCVCVSVCEALSRGRISLSNCQSIVTKVDKCIVQYHTLRYVFNFFQFNQVLISLTYTHIFFIFFLILQSFQSYLLRVEDLLVLSNARFCSLIYNPHFEKLQNFQVKKGISSFFLCILRYFSLNKCKFYTFFSKYNLQFFT